MLDQPASEGRRRVVIENVKPAVDGGRFQLKRIEGERVAIEADVFADGHDVVRAVLRYRSSPDHAWQEVAMEPLGNDRWRATIVLDTIGRWEYTILGWVDPFETWHRDLERRIEAGQDIGVDLLIGGKIVAAAVQRATGKDAQALQRWQTTLASGADGRAEYDARAGELHALMLRHPDRHLATELAPAVPVTVDRKRAEFSTWYELFPRSCSSDLGQHGTFRDCIGWLPRLADMGFDVVYLPPIHPIGATFRKGKNNATSAQAGDLGSPWAIGSNEGGHTAIHPPLGTLADFHELVAAAASLGMEIALDIAFQCSPDHPYVREHPQWFRKRPDGTVQYAENPPKKYQDIVPFDFECADWKALWQELTDVVLYWCRQGVRVFRVDNPHTKPFAFWEYLIGRVKQEFPETILLSEAFTRPKVMYRLAKLGFTQSYTYFTWRSSKAELEEYFTELTQTPVCEFFRPNLWPNTPDILAVQLQSGERSAFIARLVLAATLGASYGIYGPPYETLKHVPREPCSEEYVDSEKYEQRVWQLGGPETLAPIIATVNRVRRDHPALQSNHGLQFHPTDNEQLICYSKRDDAGANVILVVVNLSHREQHGHVDLSQAEMPVNLETAYRVEDLLNGRTYEWRGARNFVELDPAVSVAHVFRLLPSA